MCFCVCPKKFDLNILQRIRDTSGKMTQEEEEDLFGGEEEDLFVFNLNDTIEQERSSGSSFFI